MMSIKVGSKVLAKSPDDATPHGRRKVVKSGIVLKVYDRFVLVQFPQRKECFFLSDLEEVAD